MSPLLGGLEPETFLAKHWQRQPLLVRGAFPELPVHITAEELAGLALDPEVESRAIIGETAQEDWVLVPGPFETDFFAETPDEDWTLLVHDVDKHLPAFAAMLEPFNFLPDWRIDDLMVSYAAPGGTAGPHLDRYDVFLIQASGHRRWRIQQPPPAVETLRDHPQLRLLADFTASDEWLLAPGDMLYLPPGLPHYGIAENDCITFSVGLRAPSGPELLASWASGHRGTGPCDNDRYRDPLGTRPPRGHLDAATLARLRALMRNAADASDTELDHWLARHLSEPKPAFCDLGDPAETALETTKNRLQAGETLYLNPASRLLIADTSEGPRAYIHGQAETLGNTELSIAERLAESHRLNAEDLPERCPDRNVALALVARWRSAGYLLCREEY